MMDATRRAARLLVGPCLFHVFAAAFAADFVIAIECNDDSKTCSMPHVSIGVSLFQQSMKPKLIGMMPKSVDSLAIAGTQAHPVHGKVPNPSDLAFLKSEAAIVSKESAHTFLATAVTPTGKTRVLPPAQPFVYNQINTTFPTGSDIWNTSISWASVRLIHPSGLISNVYSKNVIWADVSYLRLDFLFVLSLVAYPVFTIVFILGSTILVGATLSLQHSTGGTGEDGKNGNQIPVMSISNFSPYAKRLYWFWTLYCRAIPVMLVFGVPLMLVSLTYSYPQEVFILLVAVSSFMMFSNGLYMVFFSSPILAQMAEPLEQSAGTTGSADECQITHWIIFPNYKEDFDVLSAALNSAAQSNIACKHICVLLAMEEREPQASKKASQLIDKFGCSFRQVVKTLHPANIPNDPPGKASNVAWAFKWLEQHLTETGQDASRVVLTIADADSNFHAMYFDRLTKSYLEMDQSLRYVTLWQSPVLHVKNYHRQPMPLVVGTIFTAMSETAVLADPNSIRFPYSTYSLSLMLAKQVGGWDAEWIAEDWHMGLKCFLLTLGKARVQPILLPTVNYTPEDSTWLGTLYARWAQAKRHALGFSDISYYFMMLPRIYCFLSHQQGNGPNLRDFWKMFFSGLAYVIRFINTHFIIGIMTFYAFMSFILKNVMLLRLHNTRHIEELFDRITVDYSLFVVASVATAISTTLCFQVLYNHVKDRMEPPEGISRLLFEIRVVHWLYTLIAFLAFSVLYCVILGAAVWIAAIKVLVSKSFDYEVAAKPTKNRQLMWEPTTPLAGCNTM